MTGSSEMASTRRVSVIIPARNEERTLPATLAQLQASDRELAALAEILVVNDGSTDRTAEVARQGGARVIDVELHNIGAVRNAGAKEATGAVLLFLDADTLLPPETLAAALRALDDGAVGGGAWVRFDDITWLQRMLAWMFTFGWLRICGWAAGCFVFCRRDAFEAVGGFNEEYFAAEERYITQALKQRGRFVILREHVLTSGRKLRLYSTAQLIGLAVRALFVNKDQLKRREGLEILYDAPREIPPPPATDPQP